MHLLALVPPELSKECLNVILVLLVEELLQLGSVGIEVYDSFKQTWRHVIVKLLRTVCDLPARKLVCFFHSTAMGK